MSSNHPRALWGFGGTPASATIPDQQGGYSCGRKFPVAPSTAGSAATVRPYVVPWTPTVDQWGIAFPAGLVGVVQNANLGVLSGDLDADFAAKWADLSGGSSMVGVPGVLPGGYTASPHVPWRTAAWSLVRLPTASGWTVKTWVPNITPMWGTVSSVFFYFSAAQIAAGTTITIRASHPGWRNLGVQVGFTRGAGVTLPSAGSYRVRISHNADGTAGGSTGDLDTIDLDHTWAAADCGNLSDATTSQSTVIACTPLASSIGTLTTFKMRTVSNTLTGLDGGGTPQLIESGVCGYYESARVDIPYPVTIAGQGALIAPGGYP